MVAVDLFPYPPLKTRSMFVLPLQSDDLPLESMFLLLIGVPFDVEAKSFATAKDPLVEVESSAAAESLDRCRGLRECILFFHLMENTWYVLTFNSDS